MTALGALPRNNPRATFVVAVGLGLLAVAYEVAVSPILAVTGLVALALVAFTTTQLPLAVGILAASFYFDDYLNGVGGNVINANRAIGALAVTAWAVDWLVRRKPLRTAPQLWAIGGLLLSILFSLSVIRDESKAVVSVSRYAMFFILFFLLLQAITTRERAERMVNIVIGGAAISAFLGLFGYFTGKVERAGGPVGDANDFAFLLATTIPLALYRFGRAAHRGRVLLGIATLLLFGAVLMSFSRGALLALAVAAVWAVVTRRIPIRWALAALGAVALAGLLAFLIRPDLVQGTLKAKEGIANQNVQTRFTFWEVALREYRSSPLVGVGAGQYEARFTEFQYPYGGIFTTHNAYLNILAELGIGGLSMFVLFLVLSWRTLRRRVADVAADAFLSAVAGAFLVALVGALFLTEQFWPPFWFLSALGFAVHRDAVAAETEEPVPAAA